MGVSKSSSLTEVLQISKPKVKAKAKEPPEVITVSDVANVHASPSRSPPVPDTERRERDASRRRRPTLRSTVDPLDPDERTPATSSKVRRSSRSRGRTKSATTTDLLKVLMTERTVCEEIASPTGKRDEQLRARGTVTQFVSFQRTLEIPGPCVLDTPAVHVLLSPGTRAAKKPRVPTAVGRRARFTVCVMGLHGSGTRAMGEYVKRFFDVDQEPKNRRFRQHRVDHGTVELSGDFRIWKHTVPLAPFGLPSTGVSGGPVVVLLTVREIRSWMASLSEHAYEIFPVSRTRRKRGSICWMLEEVEIRTEENIHYDPFHGKSFPSVPDLWTMYTEGYLRGKMDKPGSKVTYVVIRYEDIVGRPADVISELESLGVPRNGRPFAPIEESVSGGDRDRAALLQRLRDVSWNEQMAKESQAINGLNEIIARHLPILDCLGYSQ